MMEYGVKIIEHLLNKYETSKVFISVCSPSRRIACDIKKAFQEYVDPSAYVSFQAINKAVSSLEAAELITVDRERSGVIKKVYLNICNIEKAYSWIHKTPKKNILSELREVIDKYVNDDNLLGAYCKVQLLRMEVGNLPEYFDNDIQEYERILLSVQQLLYLKDETFERDFSVKYLGDSKAFEAVRCKVEALLKKYGTFSEDVSVLEELNLVRNPGYVFLKGQVTIQIQDQILDIASIPGGIALSSNSLKDISKIEVRGSSVVTIENLTSFNAFTCNDSFAIYLGGYHNTVRRDFIKLVYEQNSSKRYFHFGDIDVGGFCILNHLREKTGIRFEPFCMDISTLEDNQQYLKTLTKNDQKRILQYLQSEFADVFQYMLENNCKLEQEALDLVGVGI